MYDFYREGGRQIRKRWAVCCSGFQKVRNSKTSAVLFIQLDRPRRNSPSFQPKRNRRKEGCYQPSDSLFFFTPCMKAGCEKNLRFSSRSPRTSNFFPKSLQSAHRFRIWLLLDPGTKKESTARGGLFLSFASSAPNGKKVLGFCGNT